MTNLILFILLATMFVACIKEKDDAQKLHAQVDSLQKSLENSYTPGFGEIMENIRVHHDKLGLAGQNQNWELANYEAKLIVSGFKRIRKFHANKPEAQATGMIDPAMNSVGDAIQQKNPRSFKSSYAMLTATCNYCHKATNYGFNDITIPKASSFGNQSFDLVVGKPLIKTELMTDKKFN
jgi:hypothetical protein